MRCWVRAILAGVLATAGPTAAAQPTDLVVFGDSLSDVGNVGSTFFGSLFIPPENFGDRFTNDFVWAEVLAMELGLPVDTFSRGGGANDDNYAHGDATTGGGTLNLTVTRNLGRQLSDYLGESSPAAGDLFILWAGGNDYIDGQTDTAVAPGNITGYMDTLISGGATRFLIPNLPPLGQIPRFKGTVDEATMDTLALGHNAALGSALSAMDDDPTLSIYRIDVAGFFDNVLADPGAFGFTNTTDEAISSGPGGGVVADPDAYLFWDDVHPTGAAHELFGLLAFDALANPITGDTNLDRALDAGDIDLLVAAIGQGVSDARYDLDASGAVDAADLTQLIEGVFNTRPGDANLDGLVDGSDLAVLAGNYDQPAAGWADADYNADGVTDLLDLALTANFFNFGVASPSLVFTEAWSAVTAAPEPGMSWLIMPTAIWFARRRTLTTRTALRATGRRACGSR